MCGLCGTTGLDLAGEAFVTHCRAMLHHRGPDERSLAQEPSGFVAHNRLAIVDVEGGHQPFTSPDCRYSVTFNGEIYNHSELRRQYALQCQSHCDGAVLPELWQRFGIDSLELLRGMFALCVSDRLERTLTLAVDPLGMKPLYWAWRPDGSLAFASELPAVLCGLPQVNIDRSALSAFLEFGRMPLGASGLLEVRRMLPGEWLRFAADGSVTAQGISRIPAAAPTSSWDDVVAVFIESVALHLQSDVPTGLLLSSGVDSAAIAWAARELGVSLSTFTAAMPGAATESADAGQIARCFGHEHATLSTDPDEGLLDKYLQALDRPTTDGLNTFLVCRMAHRAGLKVVLAGTGGDELLLGYPHHRRAIGTRWPRRESSRTMRGIARTAAQWPVPRGRGRLIQFAEYGRARSGEEVVLRARSAIPPSARASLLASAPTSRRAATPVDRLVDGSRESLITADEYAHYLMPTLLADADTFSMASSLEERVPFVDAPLVAAVMALAPRSPGKVGFVCATGDPVLAAALQRRKSGFTLPMSRWMRSGPLRSAVTRSFDPDSAVSGLLGGDGVREIERRWVSGQANWVEPWAIVIVDHWLSRISNTSAWT